MEVRKTGRGAGQVPGRGVTAVVLAPVLMSSRAGAAGPHPRSRPRGSPVIVSALRTQAHSTAAPYSSPDSIIRLSVASPRAHDRPNHVAMNGPAIREAPRSANSWSPRRASPHRRTEDERADEWGARRGARDRCPVGWVVLRDHRVVLGSPASHPHHGVARRADAVRRGRRPMPLDVARVPEPGLLDVGQDREDGSCRTSTPSHPLSCPGT